MTSFSKSIATTFPPSINDSPTQGATSWYITSFTEEMLGVLGSWSGLEATIRLFCTGSSILRQKLSSPQCRLDLRFTDRTSPSWAQIPPFIQDLKGVVGISLIGTTFRTSVPSVAAFNWLRLPTTLESIRYAHGSSFQLNTVLCKTPFPHLTSLSLVELQAETFTSNLTGLLECLANGHLDSLHHLSLTTAEELPLSATVIFPPSLKSLQLGNFGGDFYISSISNLIHLEKLDISRFTKLIFGKPSFPVPPSLTALNIQNCSVMVQELEPEGSLSQAVHRFFVSVPGLSNLTLALPILNILMHHTTVPVFWAELVSLKVQGLVTQAFPLPPRLLSLSLDTRRLANPSQLPRTLGVLMLPTTPSMDSSKFSDLPPRLSKLVVSAHELHRSLKGSSEIVPFRLPSSLTIVEDAERSSSFFEPKRVARELKLLARLPNTVLVYYASEVYVRVPKRLQMRGLQGHIDKLQFSTLTTAVLDCHLALADYILFNWYEDVIETLSEQLLCEAISKGALQGITWILKKLRFHRYPVYKRCLKGHQRYSFLAISVEDGSHKKQNSSILELLIEGGFPKKAMLNSPSFISRAIEVANLALLQWLHQNEVSNWDSVSPLSRLITFEDSDPKILHFLLQQGSRLIDPTLIISRCLQNTTLTHWEHVKDLSRQYDLVFDLPLAGWVIRTCRASHNPLFIIPVLEWMFNPSNALNITIDKPWLDYIFANLFHLLCLQITSKHSGTSPKSLPLNGAPVSPDIIASTSFSTFNEQQLKEIRNFTGKPFNPSLLLDACQLFTKHGVYIFEALGNWQENTLVDVALILNNLEFLKFLASLPGYGFGAALLDYSVDRSSLRHSEISTLQSEHTSDRIIEKVVEKAIEWHCSPEIMSFLRSLSPTLNIDTISFSPTRFDVDKQGFTPAQTEKRLLFNKDLLEPFPAKSEQDNGEINTIDQPPATSFGKGMAFGKTTSVAPLLTPTKPNDSPSSDQNIVANPSSPSHVTSPSALGKGSTFGKAGAKFGSNGFKAAPATSPITISSNPSSPSASSSTPSAFGKGSSFGSGLSFGSKSSSK